MGWPAQSVRYVAARPIRLTSVALAETHGELLVDNVRAGSAAAQA